MACVLHNQSITNHGITGSNAQVNRIDDKRKINVETIQQYKNISYVGQIVNI